MTPPLHELLVATRNRGKRPELRSLLAPVATTIRFPDELGLHETADEAALEPHETFEQNALAKARYFHRLSGLPTVADDSGVEVDALGGAPGVRSRRFAGVDGPDHEVAAANNAEMLRRLDGVPAERRTARYRGVLALVRAGELDIVVSGTTEGRMLHEPRGTGGFGYDPLFLATELGMTFGEATPAEKETVSHRARAARALADALRSGS